MTQMQAKKFFSAPLLCFLLLLIGVLAESWSQAAAPLLFIAAMLVGGTKRTLAGLQELFQDRKLNVDLLMALAAIGAGLIGHWREGAVLTFIFCLSGALEAYTLGKSRNEIQKLLKLQPQSAVKVAATGETSEVPVELLKVGDQVLVAKGQQVPLDGFILRGSSLLDEAALTGEPLPVEKSVDDEILAGSLNLGENLLFRVERTSKETRFAKILTLVEQAQSEPSQTATMIEKIENIYVKAVLLLTPLIILGLWQGAGWTFEESFYRGMVLLVVASPCALVAAATPATLAALSSGAKSGVLFKGGRYLDNFSALQAITFDKTGTLTHGKPRVTDHEFSTAEPEAAAILIHLEQHSAHPLALAILNAFPEIEVPEEIQQLAVKEIAGRGLDLDYQGAHWHIGKSDFRYLDPEQTRLTKVWQRAGKTVAYLMKNETVVGMIALLDTEKPEAAQTIRYFQKQKIHTMLLTGDNPLTAETIGRALAIDEIKASATPQTKAELILAQKEQYGTNAMIGDGINDAPALANAAIGIAMGEGTDIAIDVADVVLMKNDLRKLITAHQLSQRLRRIIMQNIIFSLAVILLLVIANFTQWLSLPLGVIGHEGSTLLVILNGLRLLRPPKLLPAASSAAAPESKKTREEELSA
ncbi:heavy metal translocating P-type ATPase [Enterococcus hirae]|nr:heavy metal translocating P-type ATPase [Enterococcus hirae]